MAPASDAQKRATMKYDKEAYKKVLVRFKPDDYDNLEKHIKKYSYSKNGFINEAIAEKIDRDNCENKNTKIASENNA